ncbi:ABC transporter ATP-binding protein [Ochrobactrum chromiisoli]|uniref:ABC transporter ATP-binding protein n=1 Tax=Ochrobactrum chromiisoli TaxID=2993941 RepID=A0ABT3QSW4_9HYPH|nr:ABC transporter ATP-binding protein [Ochrobactrum chromiisoli]MCX2698709.1 ABC transporter ATP-binding protein [Ochrobactrum chromiisoli]
MVLTLKGVSKHFGSLVAVRDLSLSFDVGGIYSIIGPNGAGKSTVVNMIAGSYRVTSGEIALSGTVLNTLPKHKIAQSGIARTYQNLRLFDGMTVLENLEVCFYPRSNIWRRGSHDSLSKTQRIDLCKQCLVEFGLSNVEENLAGDLPYGKQKVLELARAFVTRAPVVLLDEPAAGLNHTETKEMTQMIAGLRAQDRAIILVEHDMDMVMSISDRVDVLNYGELLVSGTPEEIRRNEKVQEAYLGTTDELEFVRELAQSRSAAGRVRADADIIRH